MCQNSSLSIFGLMHPGPVPEPVTFQLNIEQLASWQFFQRNKFMWLHVRYVHNFKRIRHKRDVSTSPQVTRKSKTTDARDPSWNPSKQSRRESKWFQKNRWRWRRWAIGKERRWRDDTCSASSAFYSRMMDTPHQCEDPRLRVSSWCFGDAGRG